MMLLLYDYYYILDINGGYFLVQVIYLRLWNNQLKVRKTSMIFAQNNLINQSINHSCLKIPQPTWHCRQHAWSSKQAQTLPISPHRPSFHLYAGGAPNLVNESSLGRRIQKQTLHLKKDCVWAQIYMQPTQPTSTKLPLSIHIFFQQYFF